MLHDQTATKEVLPFQRKKQGTPALTSARCFSQTLWSSLPRLLRGSTTRPGDSATEKWESLRDNMHRTALATTLKSHDWFEAKSTELTPLIEYKRSSSEKNQSCRFFELPGSRSRKPPGVVQMNTGQSSAKPLSKYSCYNRQHQSDVWWHQEGTGPSLN